MAHDSRSYGAFINSLTRNLYCHLNAWFKKFALIDRFNYVYDSGRIDTLVNDYLRRQTKMYGVHIQIPYRMHVYTQVDDSSLWNSADFAEKRRASHWIRQENSGNRWKMEAVFWSENFLDFFRWLSGRFPRESTRK
jgi:hypothetical protein